MSIAPVGTAQPSVTSTARGVRHVSVPADLNPVTPADLGAIDGAAPAPAPYRVVPPPPMPGTAPELPDPEGPRAAPRQVAAMLDNGTEADSNGLPLNNYQVAMLALQILWNASRDSWDQHAKLKIMAERQRMILKQSAINASIDKIHGDRVRGVSGVFGSVTAAIMSAGTGYYGSLMSVSQTATRQAMGQAVAGAGSAMGHAVQQLLQVADKNWNYFGVKGGGFRADQADIRSRKAQRDEDIAQRLVEGARTASEAMRDAMRRAQQAISDFNDRKQQAIQSVNR